MKHLWPLLGLLAVVAMPALADQARKRALIDEMMVLTKQDSLVQSVIEQQRTALEQKLQQVVDSSPDLKARRKELEPMLAEFESKTIDIMKQALDWNKLRPEIEAVYEEVFSEEELAGAVAFYKTPPGQALLKKLPELMSASTKLVQQKMELVMPQIDALGKTLGEKISKMGSEAPK